MGLLFPQLSCWAANFRVGVSDALLALLCLFVIEGLWSLQRHEKLRDFEAYLERRRKGARQGQAPLALAALSGLYTLRGRGLDVLLCPADGLHAERLRHIACAGGGTRSAAFADTIAARSLSLTFLLGMCILIAYRYLAYREYIGQLDAVTGIMGRKMFNR